MAGINTWMRTKQKTLLVIVCAVIMFTWVIGGAISTLVVGHRIPSGRIFGESVSGHDLERTLNGLRLLVRPETVRDDEMMLGLAWETHLLAHEARRMGLSVSDSEMQAARASMFGGADGSFDREAYQSVLMRSGVTVSDFEATLRDFMLGRKLLAEMQQSVPLGFSEAWRMWSHNNAARRVKYAFVEAYELLPFVDEPTEGEIRDQYEAGRFLFPEDAPNYAGYRRKQRVKIEYIPIDPKEYEDKVEVSEESVRAHYEANREEYRFPEDEAEPEKDVEEPPSEDAEAEHADAADENDEPEEGAEAEQGGAAEPGEGEPGEAEGPADGEAAVGDEDADGEADAETADEDEREKPKYRPLETVRDEIVKELRRRKAREKAEEVRRTVVAEINRQTDVPFGSTAEPVADFKGIAEKLGLPYRTTDWFAEENLQRVFPGVADLSRHVFRNTASVVHEPRWDVEYSGGLLVYQVVDTVLAAPAPLDEIRDKVAEDVRLNKAILAAAEIAADAVAAAGGDFDAAVAEMRSRVRDMLASAAKPAEHGPAPDVDGETEPAAGQGEAPDDDKDEAAAGGDEPVEDAPVEVAIEGDEAVEDVPHEAAAEGDDAPEDAAERLAAEVVVVGESQYFSRPFEFRDQVFAFNTGIGEPGTNKGRVAKDAFQLDEGDLGVSLQREGEDVGAYVLKVLHVRRPDKEEFRAIADRETPRLLAEKRQAFLETWKSDLIQRAQPTRVPARYLAALGHWPIKPE